MNILIPLAPGQQPHPETLRSISAQTIDCSVLTHTSPLLKTGDRLLDKRINECANRNSLMLKASKPHALFLNHNVVLSSPRDVADCIDYLDMHPEKAAVAMDTKGQDLQKAELRGHVCCAAIMIRSDIWEGFQWDATTNRCSCMCVNERFRVRYLDDRKLREVGA